MSAIMTPPVARDSSNSVTGYDEYTQTLSFGSGGLNVLGRNYTQWYPDMNGFVSMGWDVHSYDGPLESENSDVMFAPFNDDLSTQHGGYMWWSTWTEGSATLYSTIWDAHSYWRYDYPETAPRNVFQVVFRVRDENDWDLIFNYETIKVNGYAGIGFPMKIVVGTEEDSYPIYEYYAISSDPPGDEFLDTDGNALIRGNYNSEILGRYVWKFQGGFMTNSLNVTFNNSQKRAFLPVSLDLQ